MYTNVNGNNANNFLNFVGITGLFSQTLVNPFTGYTITFNEIKNVNNAIYDGFGGTDTLNMTINGDVLMLLDEAGTIMIKSVEIFNASEGGDIINLAFEALTYGNVIMRGAAGDDVLWSSAGNDTLNGAEGNDNLIGGAGNDFIAGGIGDDYLDGGLGTDYLNAGEGDDTLQYTSDDIWAGGLTLADLGSTVFFADNIYLDGKNRSYDSFHADTNDDGSITVPGHDVLNMTTGSDVLIVIDSYSPQTGPVGSRVSYVDEINAGDGDDIIDMSAEDQVDMVINGDAGNDVIIASSGNDTLNGGDDNDSLYGAGGDDVLAGGAGDDVYYYALGDGSDTIQETSGTDSIHFDTGIAQDDLTFTVDGDNLLIQIGADIITIEQHYADDHSGRVESLVFADGSTFDLGSYVPNEAPDAQDDVFTSYRNATVNGNVLADNGAGADTDADNDTLSVQPATITTVNGGTVELLADGTFTYTPADDFIGTDSFDYTVLDGNGDQDTATVSLEVDYHPDDIAGSDNEDDLEGTYGNDDMFGLGGDDTLTGMNGNDHIRGGDGNDVLYGDDSILTGTTKDKVFADSVTMPDLKESVNIANLNPSGLPALGIANNNLSVDFDATATVTFRKGYAGYNNSFGTFGIAEDGTIVSSTMEWANVKDAGLDTAHTIDLPVGTDGGAFGFFIIGDGNTANNGYGGLDISGDGNIRFVYNYGKADARDAKVTDVGSKITAIYDDGATIKVLKGNVYFSTDRDESAAINKDGKTHVVSGLMDVNDLKLDVVKADLASKPVTLVKNGITVSATSGTLIANGDRIGVKTATGKDTVDGTEKILVSFDHAAEKVAIALSDINGAKSGVDFKIYIEGSTTPVLYEYTTETGVSAGKLGILLNGADFGGLITKIEIYSIANSSSAVESFYLDNIKAFIPGGADTDSIRIGFEDLYNTGDADYEDVLFDLNINPVHIGDIEGGNDILDGGAGNDTLYGEGGNDILVIGLGADIAHGGVGADIFAITLVDGDADKIMDFNAAEGDTINIADVLEGFDALADDINDFVHLVQNGANTEIHINADGDAGGVFTVAAMVLGTVDIASIVADQSALA